MKNKTNKSAEEILKSNFKEKYKLQSYLTSNLYSTYKDVVLKSMQDFANQSPSKGEEERLSDEYNIVRNNLMFEKGYTGYCGAFDKCTKGMPRTKWDKELEQFRCDCGWVSKYPKYFIEGYKAKWNKSNTPSKGEERSCKTCKFSSSKGCTHSYTCGNNYSLWQFNKVSPSKGINELIEQYKEDIIELEDLIDTKDSPMRNSYIAKCHTLEGVIQNLQSLPKETSQEDKVPKVASKYSFEDIWNAKKPLNSLKEDVFKMLPNEGNKVDARKKNAIYTLLSFVFDFVMRNLEFLPLIICLHLLYNINYDWRYWVTILTVAFASGLSTKYNIKNKR